MAAQVRELIEWLEPRGWLAQKTNGGHYRATRRGIATVIHFAATPSDHRAIENIKTHIRREEKKAGMPPQPGDRKFRFRSKEKYEGFRTTEDDKTIYRWMDCICGESQFQRMRKTSAPKLNCEIAFRMKRDLGWHIGAKRSEDRCPYCVKHPGKRAPGSRKPCADPAAKSNGNGRHPPPVVADIPTPSRESEPIASKLKPPLDLPEAEVARITRAYIDTPQRETRAQASLREAAEMHKRWQVAQRRIMRAIDKVYVDPATGYMLGESDVTVAARLKIDVGAVTKLRAELFGPLVADGCIAEAKRELSAFKRNIERFQHNMIDALAELEAQARAVTQKLTAVENQYGVRAAPQQELDLEPDSQPVQSSVT